MDRISAIGTHEQRLRYGKLERDLEKVSKLFDSRKQDIRSEKQVGNIKSRVFTEDRIKESKSGHSGKAYQERKCHVENGTFGEVDW